MTDLDQALGDIHRIRREVAQNTAFRGYGPLTLSATAGFALLAGAAQACWVPDPGAQRVKYVAIWITTAALSAAVILTQMFRRASRLHSGMANEMVRTAIAQFLPAAVTGMLLPFALLRTSPSVFWMLPGLWQMIFGLGVFASCRCLPRLMLLAGVWFLLSGLTCLSLGDARALSPAAMANSYAVGMAFVAAVHYFSGRAGVDEH